MLEKVKLALRITTTAFDSELNDLIDAAKVDLGIAGVVVPVTTETSLDVIIQKAIITYCKLNFGEPDEYDRLKRSYDEQKAQLSMATGYTLWTDQT
ncbi:MAG: phage gp6-like head-tail connector protein [Spirochaetales bacterium]|nr:phage gp6-like head-tail connector protein [Spirochaetales bacterium]